MMRSKRGVGSGDVREWNRASPVQIDDEASIAFVKTTTDVTHSVSLGPSQLLQQGTVLREGEWVIAVAVCKCLVSL